MNINELDLNSEENKKKVNIALQSLKTKLTLEEAKRKEAEEKYYNLSQSKSLLDQKLAKTEQAFKRKSEEVLQHEEKIIDLQKKLDSLLYMQQSKKGFFGFRDDENKILRKKLINLEAEFEIKSNELERLHELLFETKKQFEELEKQKQQEIVNLENDLQQQIEIITKEKQFRTQLEKQIQDHLQVILQKEKELKDCKQKLNQQDDEIRHFKDQIQIQLSQQNELQNTLILKKEELKKTYQDADQMKISLSSIKEFMFNIIPQLETELQNSQQLLYLKQFIDKTFGIDKQRDSKIIQIKQEQELQKELLVVKDGYQVFLKAKDRILKMGKNIEQLEKRNKQLQDKIYVLENKRTQNKGDYLSDKISVI